MGVWFFVLNVEVEDFVVSRIRANVSAVCGPVERVDEAAVAVIFGMQVVLVSLRVNSIDVEVVVVTADRKEIFTRTVRYRCAVLLSLFERRNLCAEVRERANTDLSQVVANDDMAMLQRGCHAPSLLVWFEVTVSGRDTVFVGFWVLAVLLLLARHRRALSQDFLLRVEKHDPVVISTRQYSRVIHNVKSPNFAHKVRLRHNASVCRLITLDLHKRSILEPNEELAFSHIDRLRVAEIEA